MSSSGHHGFRSIQLHRESPTLEKTGFSEGYSVTVNFHTSKKSEVVDFSLEELKASSLNLTARN